MKFVNYQGRISQVKSNPNFSKELAEFKFRCDFTIVHNCPHLPANPVAVLKYKSAPGFCPVPLRVRQIWSTVGEPKLEEEPGLGAVYRSTDQLVLQWQVNPATPLTSLSFLIDPATANRSPEAEKSKPPGR